MKKLLFMLFAGMLLFPIVTEATTYKIKDRIETDEPPIRNPTTLIDVNLNETTGILTLLCVGNVGSMEVTISQNGVTIENDVIAVSNGQSVIYNLSGYVIGEYLLTIETADGAITQYIIYVEDD